MQARSSQSHDFHVVAIAISGASWNYMQENSPLSITACADGRFMNVEKD